MEESRLKLRTIIAGSRTVQTEAAVWMAIAQAPWDISVVLSGHARGVDRLGEDWAIAHKVPLEVYPARWDENGPAAGFIRNQQMADQADALIAIWDGESRGTLDMIRRAKGRGLYIHVVDTKENT